MVLLLGKILYTNGTSKDVSYLGKDILQERREGVKEIVHQNEGNGSTFKKRTVTLVLWNDREVDH